MESGAFRFALAWRLCRALLVGLVLMQAGAAFAADEGATAIRAHDLTIAGDGNHTRLVLRFDGEPETRWFLLRDPHRLVIDLPETEFDIARDELEPRGLVSHVRYGNLDSGTSRMILSMSEPFVPDAVKLVANESGAGYRMIVDISAATPEEFVTALRTHMRDDAAEGKAGGDAHGVSTGAENRFTVVLDPGHGGIDSGARGTSGTPEKTITLAFALELRKKLQEIGDYNVVMTRDSDIFLRLDERVKIARKRSADLFISIHADSIRYRRVRGATVYTESDRASDAKAAATAARENLSDELAGIEVEAEKSEVADILVDLIRRETHTFSNRFARSIVEQFSESINLVTNPHRYAGFRVLQAPDVPSVLLELGYLSNPKDEELLRSADWRQKAIGGIAEAIGRFAATKAAAGG